ncbi:MAG: hypothetical protein IPL08_13495 [Saprospiraceae bacterium]|nr:hypothetical protein [Saprospiraceae bacterium]
MQKRTFIKNLMIATAGSTILDPFYIFGSSPKPKNWIWARPNTSWKEDDWKRKLAKAKESGIDALLLEIYNGTDTYYEGDSCL